MKKSKLLKTLTIFGAAACAPLLLAGCGEVENKTAFRVQDGYIQTTVDGFNWTNLVALEDIKGEDGTDGDAGSKITSITKDTTNSTAEKTIYIIELEDGTKYPFEVLNGTDGKDGTDADVWTIGADGYWYKNSVKTDKKAIGTDGSNGENGKDADIWTIGINGNWYKNGADTGNKAVGEDGEDGNGIKAITKDTTNSTSEKTIYIIELEDGTKYPFEVKNGLNGKDGVDATYETYTITFDYNSLVDVKSLFDNYKINQELKSTEWLIEMPTLNVENPEEYFEGWYIEGTDKKIENYDFIGGNITLVAHWVSEDNTCPFNKSDISINCTNFTYNAELDGYDVVIDTSKSIVVVPDTYNDDTNGEKNIVSISAKELNKANNNLIYVKLPENLIKISSKTFYYCDKLTNINIPKSVINIGSNVFEGCGSLESLTIPYIGDKDYLSNAMKYNACSIGYFFGMNNFEGASKLSYYINVNNTNYVNEYYIPTSLKKITVTGDDLVLGAFSGCSQIEEIVLTGNIKTIPSYAFRKCSALKSFTIPSSVTSIGETAFAYSGLTSVELPNNVTTLGESVFEGCHLSSIVISSSVTSIGEDAFSFMNLNTVIIDSETIANSLILNDSQGSLIDTSMNSVQIVYIKTDLNISNSTYLLQRFMKQETSDKVGYDMWVKK